MMFLWWKRKWYLRSNWFWSSIFWWWWGNEILKINIDEFTLSEGFVSLTDLSTGFHGSKNDPDHELNDILVNIENVDLSGSYAEIIGGDEDNVNRFGNDVITGGLRNDIIDGGKGDDTYIQQGILMNGP